MAELGIPSDESATVLTECAFCPTLIEVETGARGVEQAVVQGWEIVADSELCCPLCALSRAAEVEDYA